MKDEKVIQIALMCMEIEKRRLHSLGLSGLHPSLILRERNIDEAMARIKEIMEIATRIDQQIQKKFEI